MQANMADSSKDVKLPGTRLWWRAVKGHAMTSLKTNGGWERYRNVWVCV